MLKGLTGKDHDARWFLLPAVILLLAATIISVAVPRETIHMACNRVHAPFLDGLFRIWTFLGSGVGALIIILITLLARIRFTLSLFAGYAISGIAVQLMKRLLFSHAARPVKYFELREVDFDLYLVPGVELHSWHSFPSGHSATAFALFFGLSLILRMKWMQLTALMLAVGVAYSRIYLSQHFLMDVVGGAVIGLVGGYAGWRWIMQYDSRWLNRSLPELLHS